MNGLTNGRIDVAKRKLFSELSTHSPTHRDKETDGVRERERTREIHIS